MKKQIIQTLKGFRDILPTQKRKNDFIETKIIETFKLFGFEPLQTPTLEYAELLLGKYGTEADRLVYNFKDKGGRKVALPYDQTVPTARVLAQYQNILPKFFKRYSIKNVFRAEKPQKGRYREFTQCDVDIFGSTKPFADAEILATSFFVMQNIGFKNINILINDRKTLISTLDRFATDQVQVNSIIQSIDKLDKKTSKEVVAELIAKGLNGDVATQALQAIRKAQISPELTQIIKLANSLGVAENTLIFTPTLARGLDYYTGMIFEIQIPEYSTGSCGGGGRYDDLINQLSGTNIPAVGVGLGFDRIVEAAEALNLIPENSQTKILIASMDRQYLENIADTANRFRAKNISVEVYPECSKIGKQFKYADSKKIPFVIILGEDEIKQQKLTIKDLKTGKQQLISIEECILKFK